MAAFLTDLILYIWWGTRYFYRQQGPFLACVGIALAVSGVAISLNRWRPAQLGLTGRGFWRSLKSVVLPTCIAAVLLWGVAEVWEVRGRPASLAKFSSLCLWALLQQYALQSFLVNILRELGVRPVAWVAAVLFSLLHLPNPFLMAVTLVGGWVWCSIFVQDPNIFSLSLSHAILSLATSWALPSSWTYGMVVGPRFFDGAKR